MTNRTATRTAMLLLALGAPVLLPAGAAHADLVPAPLTSAVTSGTAPVVEAVAPVVTAVVPAPAPTTAAPAAPASAEPEPTKAPLPLPEPVAQVLEPVTDGLPTGGGDPAPRPTGSSAPSPSSTSGPTVSLPGTSGPQVRPESGSEPSPVARPSGTAPVATAGGTTTGTAGGAGTAALDPSRMYGQLTVGQRTDGGSGTAVLPPLTAGALPALAAGLAAPGVAPLLPQAAPLSGDARRLLPSVPARPTDLPAALVVLASVAVAAVGAGQATEVVSRRQALAR